MPTLFCPFVLMPVSVATLVPLQPCAGSFGPVIVNPFKPSTISGAANAMQGAPVTWQVMSPTSRVFSDSISVRVTLPLMSSARAMPVAIIDAPQTNAATRNALSPTMIISFRSRVDRRTVGVRRRLYHQPRDHCEADLGAENEMVQGGEPRCIPT